MVNKRRVAVFFGGKSPEHEVSIITGIQTIEHLDKDLYDVIPVYIAKDGKWYSGPELTKIETFRNLLIVSQKGTQETITLDNENKGLLPTVTKSLTSLNPFKKSLTPQPIDVIFNASHGGLGENGGLSGVFEAMDLPYVGPGITGGVLGMDKVTMKHVFEANNIPITKWIWFYRNSWKKDFTTVEKYLKYPLFVKPASGGSSIGTTKVHNRKELENALEVAMVFDNKIIIEESFENAREINVSVMGNAGGNVSVSVCEEVFSSGEVLTYEDKYIGSSKGGSKGMATTKREIPAKIPKEIESKIQETAAKVFNVLDGSGVSRIDFLYRENTKEIVVLEINTIPGSLSFYLWEASGLPFKNLLNRLIDSAYERYNDSKKNTTTFASNILENFNSSGAKGK